MSVDRGLVAPSASLGLEGERMDDARGDVVGDRKRHRVAELRADQNHIASTATADMHANSQACFETLLNLKISIRV